jgi:hypothetical protein
VPQIAFTFFSFARQQVAFEPFGALDFTAAGDLESFHRPSIAFDFGHVNLLFVFCNCLCNFEFRRFEFDLKP